MTAQAGKYIYGIIERPQNNVFSLEDFEGVGTIEQGDLLAVVGSSPVRTCDLLDEQLQASDVRRHQLVLERILKDRTVIPMSFGIIARDENDVKKLLQSAYDDFKDTIRELDNRIELNLQVRCCESEALILRHVASTDETVRKLREALASASAEITESVKLELGKAVVAAIAERKAEYARDIVSALSKIADQSLAGKLTAKDMIINESFLVLREKEAEFDHTVNGLGEKYGDRLKFKYIGPMPPYSFVNLAVTMINAQTVDGARKVLGLDSETTLVEIKKAHRALARQYHPDSNHGEPDGVESFERITQAFDILVKYVRKCKAGDDGTISFEPDHIEDVLVITRRR
ncbi:MAG: GvpL/GvpF family gas vesicle protein [Dehalococcoidia bacterium]|nr:GvpL/GvpF family gas vesicle protein [Dehalococcoidia bacterium]